MTKNEKTDTSPSGVEGQGERMLALAVVYQAVQDVEFHLKKIRKINAEIQALRIEGRKEDTSDYRRDKIIKKLGMLDYERGHYISEVKYDWRWIFRSSLLFKPLMEFSHLCQWNEVDPDYMRGKILKRFAANRKQKTLKRANENGRNDNQSVD